MLFSGVADRFKRFEPGKQFITPSPRQLTRDPGVRCLTDRDRSIVWLIRRDDHSAMLGRKAGTIQTEILEATGILNHKLHRFHRLDETRGFAEHRCRPVREGRRLTGPFALFLLSVKSVVNRFPFLPGLRNKASSDWFWSRMRYFWSLALLTLVSAHAETTLRSGPQRVSLLEFILRKVAAVVLRPSPGWAG